MWLRAERNLYFLPEPGTRIKVILQGIQGGRSMGTLKIGLGTLDWASPVCSGSENEDGIAGSKCFQGPCFRYKLLNLTTRSKDATRGSWPSPQGRVDHLCIRGITYATNLGPLTSEVEDVVRGKSKGPGTTLHKDKQGCMAPENDKKQYGFYKSQGMSFKVRESFLG